MRELSEEVSGEALDAMQAIADSLVAARTARNLTQAQVAEACSMSIGTYQAVERGALTPSMRSYVKVLDYLGMAKTLAFIGAPIFDEEGRILRSRKKH